MNARAVFGFRTPKSRRGVLGFLGPTSHRMPLNCIGVYRPRARRAALQGFSSRRINPRCRWHAVGTTPDHRRPARVNGSSRSRRPVAAYRAPANAGAIGGTASSPAPPTGAPLSISSIVIRGACGRQPAVFPRTTCCHYWRPICARNAIYCIFDQGALATLPC